MQSIKEYTMLTSPQHTDTLLEFFPLDIGSVIALYAGYDPKVHNVINVIKNANYDLLDYLIHYQLDMDNLYNLHLIGCWHAHLGIFQCPLLCTSSVPIPHRQPSLFLSSPIPTQWHRPQLTTPCPSYIQDYTDKYKCTWNDLLSFYISRRNDRRLRIVNEVIITSALAGIPRNNPPPHNIEALEQLILVGLAFSNGVVSSSLLCKFACMGTLKLVQYVLEKKLEMEPQFDVNYSNGILLSTAMKACASADVIEYLISKGCTSSYIL